MIDLVAKYGRRWDAVEQSPYVAYRRQNCTATYGCVTSWRQIYYDDGASTEAPPALVNDYGLRGAGMWALGYDGGHPRALPGDLRVVPRRQGGTAGGHPALAATQPDEGFVVCLGSQGRERASRPTTSRSRGRRRLDGLADGHEGDLATSTRARTAWLRVPRPGA